MLERMKSTWASNEGVLKQVDGALSILRGASIKEELEENTKSLPQHDASLSNKIKTSQVNALREALVQSIEKVWNVLVIVVFIFVVVVINRYKGVRKFFGTIGGIAMIDLAQLILFFILFGLVERPGIQGRQAASPIFSW